MTATFFSLGDRPSHDCFNFRPIYSRSPPLRSDNQPRAIARLEIQFGRETATVFDVSSGFKKSFSASLIGSPPVSLTASYSLSRKPSPSTVTVV